MNLQWSLEFWHWIPETWLFLATLGGATATGFFALRTYKLQKQLIELQYAPKLQLYSLENPQDGTITSQHDRTVYTGVTWKLHMLNPSDIPIAAGLINVDVSPALGRQSWTSVAKLSLVLNSRGEPIERGFVIEGHGHLDMIVILYGEDTLEHLKRIFGEQDRFIMAVRSYQYRQFAGKDTSGWLSHVSSPFQLPAKFGSSGLRTWIVT